MAHPSSTTATPQRTLQPLAARDTLQLASQPHAPLVWQPGFGSDAMHLVGRPELDLAQFRAAPQSPAQPTRLELARLRLDREMKRERLAATRPERRQRLSWPAFALVAGLAVAGTVVLEALL